MGYTRRRTREEVKEARSLNCNIVHYDKLRKMAGVKSNGWFIDELIDREYKRREAKATTTQALEEKAS